MNAQKYPFGIALKGVKTVSNSTTLTKEDADKLIVIDSATGLTVTLPPTRKNVVFRFFIKTVATAGTHAISPNANDTIFFKGASAFADDKDMEHTSATEVIGDGCTLVGDGQNGWYAVEVNGAFNRET